MASNNEAYDDHFKGLIWGFKEVQSKLEERQKVFEESKRIINSLSSVQTLEPHYKIIGGPAYKTVNYKEQKQQALAKLDRSNQKYNQEIYAAIKGKLSDPELSADQHRLKDYDVIELLDEAILEQQNAPFATSMDINKYLARNNLQPGKTRAINEKEPTKVEAWKENEIEMGLEFAEKSPIEQNKNDIEREPDL